MRAVVLGLFGALADAGAGPGNVTASGEWTTVRPGGTTGCATGDPFEFWVSRARKDRVLVYFQGGGACWDATTCDPRRRPTYDFGIDATDHAQRADGIFDRAEATNPFRSHSFVFVPYCTGDFHLGAKRLTYAPAADDPLGPVAIHHAGFHNLSAVVAHVRSSFPAAAEVVVAGGSAGAIAAPIAALQLAPGFPRARLWTITDGIAGIRTQRVRALMETTGAAAVLASLGVVLDESRGTGCRARSDPPGTGNSIGGRVLAADPLAQITCSVARRVPQMRFTSIATDADTVVAGWLTRFEEDGSRVAANIDETFAELRDSGLCFRGYVLPGAMHTVLWRRSIPPAKGDGRRLLEAIVEDLDAAACGPAAEPTTALLFAYRPKTGMADAFAQGYRRHLAWHAERRDPLTWLGWTVLDGPNLGTFVDGTFGLAPRALDERPDPAGDAADAARNVVAYADPLWRATYRLRPDLGSASPLEHGLPAALQKVVSVQVEPGRTADFDAIVAAHLARPGAAPTSVYERVTGGTHPAYLLVVALRTWEALQDDPTPALVDAAGRIVAHASSEVWQYRPDLTYFPGRD